MGHAHPRVAAAVGDQAAALNTNIRYLHPNICLLAQRLTATFPKGSNLEVCFFVNSGSEANDLACRLAFARSASRDIVTVDNTEDKYQIKTLAWGSCGGIAIPSGVPPVFAFYRLGASDLRGFVIQHK